MTLARDTSGISTSGSFLLIFIGFFIAVGTLYSATANTTERLTDDREDSQDRFHERQDTQINVTGADWDATNGDLTVTVNNTGSTTLSVNETDILVDGHYVALSDFETRTVQGQETDVWAQNEQLRLVDTDTVAATLSNDPQRVKVVTGSGVATTQRVVTN